jgi:EpsG family
MVLYWLLLSLPLLAAIGNSQTSCESLEMRSWGIGFHLYFILLILTVGWRHEVGGDWGNYLPMIDVALQLSFAEATLQSGDTAYNVLTWLSANAGTGIYGVNLMCAVVFAYGLMVFCQNSPRPWLSLTVAVPYLVIVVAMGYTRQGVAIGLVMLGLVSLEKGSIAKFVTWMTVAVLFHKTALILIPIAIFAGRKNWVAMVGVLLTTVMLFLLLLAEYVEHLVAGYITDQMTSSGATIRVAMNALPAVVFLVFRKRFNLTDAQRIFWTWMSLGGIAFIGLLAVSPSSTAVDRVALYWIPLQLFVWARLPNALGRQTSTQRMWLVLVLLYAFTVQFVWLFYADHNWGWLPYQFYPWVWLWS